MSIPKNLILTESGRSPWFNSKGESSNAYIIGIAGGSASGKTRVAQAILNKLQVPWVTVIAQDNFYKSLTPEQSKQAFNNNYDFDCPEAFDYDALNDCLRELKQCHSVQIPNYSFTLHQRCDQTSYLYGAEIIIVEGIFALHSKETRDLCDLKVFVQCDSDIMLARRLQRDLVERGRDVTGVIDQYLKFVKPSYDSYILPTSKFADVIVPGLKNEISIELITSHIRRQLEERKSKLKEIIWKGIDFGKDKEELPSNLIVMEQTNQLKGIHTILRDTTTSNVDFLFFADRLSTLVIETSLSLLPTKSKSIITPTETIYKGEELTLESNSQLCGVTILRSGASLEVGLRRVIRDCHLGNLLIDSDELNESLLFTLNLPTTLTISKESANKSIVLLLDSQIGTGSSALMAIKILLDHGVKEENIIFNCLLVSKVGGIHLIFKVFPKVRIVTSAVDPWLEERWIWPTHGTEQEKRAKGPRKIFAIVPGVGAFGQRYFGAP